MKKTFTLTEARALVPLLRREIRVLQPIYAQLKLRWKRTAKSHGLRIADPAVRKLCLADETTRELLLEVEERLSMFRELGVECKGIEQGLFDFPCLVEDRVVFLCWHVDEQEISHWHEVGTGYVGRRPLFEATRLEAGRERPVN